MHGGPPFQLVNASMLPPWGWSRRQLIARSALWFSVFPRTFKPEVLELSRNLARSARRFETVATLKWPHSDLRLYGEQLLHELVGGSGIAYVTGLCSPEADLSDEVLRWAYLLLGMQIGNPVSSGSLLLDLSARNACSPPEHRLTGITQTQTMFHTDSSAEGSVPELVGTLCLRPAMQGGESEVSSAVRARELLRDRCHHLLEELYTPFCRDGAAAGTQNVGRPVGPGRERPIFSHRMSATGLCFDYARRTIESSYRRADRSLGPKQQLALDYLDEALSDPAGCMQFQMKRGDMLFVNNHIIAHNRREFVDGPESARRLMVRMWLSVPKYYLTRG